LDIRLNTEVKKIKYYDGGVEVTAQNLGTNNSEVVHKGEKEIENGNAAWGSASLGLRRERDENIKDAWLIKIISSRESSHSLPPKEAFNACIETVSLLHAPSSKSDATKSLSSPINWLLSFCVINKNTTEAFQGDLRYFSKVHQHRKENLS
jgi:hypothetical protein